MTQRKLECGSQEKAVKSSRSHSKQGFRMKKTINTHVPTKVYVECEAAGKSEALILMNLFDVPFSLTKS